MALPPFNPVSADVCVAPQIDAAAVADLAAAGFKSIINNRPDFEGGAGQPTAAEIGAAAQAAGLAYAHLPVAPSVQTPQEIAQFAELLRTLPRPIFAFCRSGARSGKLFAAAQG